MPAGADDAGAAAKRGPIRVNIPKWSGKWVVGMDGFQDGVSSRLRIAAGCAWMRLRHPDAASS